jgi:hypothetical protein
MLQNNKSFIKSEIDSRVVAETTTMNLISAEPRSNMVKNLDFWIIKETFPLPPSL